MRLLLLLAFLIVMNPNTSNSCLNERLPDMVTDAMDCRVVPTTLDGSSPGRDLASQPERNVLSRSILSGWKKRIPVGGLSLSHVKYRNLGKSLYSSFRYGSSTDTASLLATIFGASGLLFILIPIPLFTILGMLLGVAGLVLGIIGIRGVGANALNILGIVFGGCVTLIVLFAFIFAIAFFSAFWAV